MWPLVSVLMPTFDRLRFLAAAIDLLRAQTLGSRTDWRRTVRCVSGCSPMRWWPCRVCWSRSLLDEVGPLDEELVMCYDDELWLRLAARSELDGVDECLTRAALEPSARARAPRLLRAAVRTVRS